MSKASLIVGNGNWAIKDSSLLGYNINDSNIYSPFPFNVNRLTPATRVDKDGLIVTDEEILSGELITNGDFSDGSTDWTIPGTGWSVSGNKAVVTNAPDLYQRLVQPSLSFNLNSTYKVSVTCSEYSSGSVYLRKPRGAEPDTSLKIDSVGTFVFTLNALTELTEFALAIGELGTDLSIDNVSVVEINQNNLARIDYTDSDEGVLLTEPQSTNFIPYSEDFSNSSWLKGDSSVVGGFSSPSADSPLGAFKIVEDTSTSNHHLRINASVTTGLNYTLSFYLKADETQFVQLLFGTGAFGTMHANFDLTNGVVTVENGCTANISSSSLNGYYKCSVTALSIATQSASCYVFSIQSGTSLRAESYTGDGTSGLYVFGAQVEQLSYATSYIPTSGSTVTRNQDLVTNGGEVSTFNSEEGVLFVEIAALVDDSTNRIISLSEDGNTNNRVNIFYTTNSNRMKFTVRVNNSNEFVEDIELSNILDYNKIALKYKENNFSIYINGVKEVEQLSGSIYPANTLDKLNFDQASGSLPFFGKTKNIQVFKKALSDSELQILTTI